MKIAIIGSYSTKIFLMELEKLFSKGYTLYETEYSQIEHEVFNKSQAYISFLLIIYSFMKHLLILKKITWTLIIISSTSQKYLA